VSSILRALKKLEDRPADAAGAPPWREKFASEHARHSRSPRAPWRSTPVITVGAVVLLAAGWLVTHRPPAGEKTAPAATRSERPVAAAQSTSRQPGETPTSPAAGFPSLPRTGNADATPPPFVARIQEAQQKRREALETQRTATPKVTPPLNPERLATMAPALPPQPVTGAPSKAPISAPAPDRNDVREPQASATEEASNDTAPAILDHRGPTPDRPPEPTRTAAATPTRAITTPARTLPTTSPRSQPEAPVRRPLQAAPSPAQDEPAAQAAPTFTRLRDDAVKLQAVAWSSVPERRMAVINEQVVREGNTIEGYTIATIREESVIVRKGAESWELRYGH